MDLTEYSAIDISSIKKQKFSTERDIERETEPLLDLLSDTKKDWKQRLNALMKIQSILVGNAPQYEAFSVFLKKLIAPLSEQVNDLRSAIVREACKTIDIMSVVYKDTNDLELFANKYITSTSLLKVVQGTNKLIADYGHNAILSLIHHSVVPKLFSKIIEEIKSKNNNMRLKCAQYAYTMLILYSDSVLDKYIHQIEEIIANSVGDAIPQARACGRACYEQYKLHFPQRAEALFSRFDASNQKTILEANSVSSPSRGLSSTGQFKKTGKKPNKLGKTGEFEIQSCDSHLDSEAGTTYSSMHGNTRSSKQSLIPPPSFKSRPHTQISAASGSSKAKTGSIALRPPAHGRGLMIGGGVNSDLSAEDAYQRNTIGGEAKFNMGNQAKHTKHHYDDDEEEESKGEDKLARLNRQLKNRKNQFDKTKSSEKKNKLAMSVDGLGDQDLAGELEQKKRIERERMERAQKLERLEKEKEEKTKEREREKQREKELKMKMQAQMQREKEREVELKFEKEKEKKRERLKQQELEKERERELKEKERELEKEKLQKHFQEKENEKKKQLQREKEAQRKREEENKRKREKEREEEVQRKKEEEIRKKREEELKRKKEQQVKRERDEEMKRKKEEEIKKKKEGERYMEERLKEAKVKAESRGYSKDNQREESKYLQNNRRHLKQQQQQQEEEEEDEDEEEEDEDEMLDSGRNRNENYGKPNKYDSHNYVQNKSKLTDSMDDMNEFEEEEDPDQDQDSAHSYNNYKHPNKNHDSHFNQYDSNDNNPPLTESDVQKILEETDSDVWETRKTAFEDILEIIQNEEASDKLSGTTLGKAIMETFIEHMTDVHFKVVCVVLKGINHLIVSETERLHSYDLLEILIPKLMYNISDKKKEISEDANYALELLNTNYSPDLLIPSFIKSLNSNHILRVKTGALEVLILLIKNSTSYFKNNRNVKSIVDKIGLLLEENSGNKRIINPLIGVLLSMRDKNLKGTIGAIYALPQAQFHKIKSLAHEFAQDLEDNINQYLKKPSESSTKSEKRGLVEEIEYIGVGKEKRETEDSGERFYKESGGGLLKGKGKIVTTSGSMHKKNSSGGHSNTGDRSPNTSSSTSVSKSTLPPNQKKKGSGTNVAPSAPPRKHSQKDMMGKESDRDNVKDKGIDIQTLRTLVDNPDLQTKLVMQVINTLRKANLKEEEYKLFWDQDFMKIVNFLFKIILKNHLDTQEVAFVLMKELMEQQFDRFEICCESVTQNLLECYQFQRQLWVYIDTLFDTMLLTMGSTQLLSILTSFILEKNPPTLQSLIRLLTKIISKSQASDLIPNINPLAKNLIHTFNHPNADVRKSVVFCLVEIHFHLGRDFEPYLQELNPSQQKLVMIYIGRRGEAK